MKFFSNLAVLILGFLIGTTIGEIAQITTPERWKACWIFFPSITAGFNPAYLDLKVFSFTLGFHAQINFFSLAALIITAFVILIMEFTSRS